MDLKSDITCAGIEFAGVSHRMGYAHAKPAGCSQDTPALLHRCAARVSEGRHLLQSRDDRAQPEHERPVPAPHFERVVTRWRYELEELISVEVEGVVIGLPCPSYPVVCLRQSHPTICKPGRQFVGLVPRSAPFPYAWRSGVRFVGSGWRRAGAGQRA